MKPHHILYIYIYIHFDSYIFFEKYSKKLTDIYTHTIIYIYTYTHTQINDIGHGEYNEISGDKEFFAALKKCPAAAIHFYRPATERCRIMDKHMKILAKKYVEAKFLKINAEKCPYVCEKLQIWCLPSVVLVKEGKTNYTIVGFNDMGCEDEFETDEMAFVLGEKGIIKYQGPAPEDKEQIPRGGKRRGFNKHQKSSFRQREDSDSDLDD